MALYFIMQSQFQSLSFIHNSKVSGKYVVLIFTRTESDHSLLQ